MRVGGELLDDLLVKGDADALGIGFGARECAIIEAFSSAEANALPIKSKSGAKEEVDLLDGNDREIWSGFGDAEGSGAELLGMIDLMENEGVADDAGENPAVVALAGDEIEQIGLAGEWGEAGDAAAWRIDELGAELAANVLRLRVLIANRGQDLAQVASPLGFSCVCARTCLLHCHLSG